MDNKKFEKLIELIINENEEQARDLFHEIVVEKSREIYESIMDDEMMGNEQMVGEVGDLMDEINAEEAGGMVEDEESDDMDMEMDMDDEEDEEEISIDADDVGEVDDEVEDAVIRIEDKLDQLMADFERIMGDEEGEDLGDVEDEEGGEEEPAGEEEPGEEEPGEEEPGEEEPAGEEEPGVMEAITLKKVSVTHGDNGQNTRSIALTEPKIKTQGVNPVKFSGASESVPSSPKAPSNAYTKGETQVKHAGQWKNAPAQAGQDLESAPKPKHGDDGQNTRSPLGESKRKIVKRRI